MGRVAIRQSQDCSLKQIIVVVTTSLVTLAAIMLLYHHHIQGLVTSQRIKFLILGVMLGGGASLLMLHPIELTSDLTFSNRPMFVAFAGLLGGWVGAVSALVITSATRIAIAGPNMSIGILLLSVAAALGVLGHTFLNRTRLRPPWSWTFLGGLLCLSVALFWTLIMLEPMRGTLLRNTVVILIIASAIGGAVAAGYLHYGVSNVVHQRQRAMTESRVDELTGVFNRRGLNTEYQSFVLQTPEPSVALLAIDLDHFKLVNDRFGHVSGDRLLKLIADQINQFIRKGDIVARIGGDEFVVVLKNTTQEEAKNTAERLCRAIEDGPLIPETDSQLYDALGVITVSVGVAFTNAHPERLDALLEASDELLYTAKKNGRGRVVAKEVEFLNQPPA